MFYYCKLNVLSDNLLDKQDHHAYRKLIVEYLGIAADPFENYTTHIGQVY